MAQISSLGSLPDPSLHISSVSTKASSTGNTSKTQTSAATDQAEASPLQAQLTRLSSVLNSLQNNASTSRAQYVQALAKVKSGTYSIDSLGVSKSIVSDLLKN